jgi:nicotinamidase-related amidase
MPSTAPQPLRADASVLLLVDYQPRMYYGVEGSDRTLIFNNALALAKAASILGIPTVLTSIGEGGNGPFTPEIVELFPRSPVIERSVPGFDALDDPEVLEAVKAPGRKQLVVSGLWTSMCFSFSALHGRREGFEVFGVMDAAGSESMVAHEMAVQRMVQAGVVPCTWLQVACEWMAVWSNPQAPELIERVYRLHNGFFAQKPSHEPRPHRGIAAPAARAR